MRILRRSALFEPEDVLAIRSAGVEPDSNGVFVVAEDDVRWPEVSKVLERLNDSALSITEFDDVEFEEARYLELGSDWYNGYPQPDEDFNYVKSVFDTSSMCPECHIGTVQIAPFRLKKPPHWGRRSFFTLFWEHAIFVRKDIYDRVFGPVGVDAWPVVVHKTGAVIEDTVQLKPMEMVHVDVEGLIIEKCPVCGVDKYNWQNRGFQPRPLQGSAPVLGSFEWFGSGWGSAHMMMVSHQIYEQIKDLRGLQLQPCAQ